MPSTRRLSPSTTTRRRTPGTDRRSTTLRSASCGEGGCCCAHGSLHGCPAS
jgi:hypothetical protein